MRKSGTTALAALMAVVAGAAQAPGATPAQFGGQPAVGIVAPPAVPLPAVPPPLSGTPLTLPPVAPPQPAGPPPAVRPAQVITPLLPTLPPPQSVTPVPAPPDGFGVSLPPGTVVSPGVRPPMPVTGAPEEIPPGPKFWGGIDYLLWKVKGGYVPPLVVASPGPVPTFRSAVTLSGDTINNDLLSGLRFTAGMWLDKPHGTGIVASYLSFFEGTESVTYRSGPGVVLARPFNDVTRGVPALFQLSTPTGTTDGMATIRTALDVDGLEVNMLRRGPAMIGEEMHWIVGVRYIGLEESLNIETLSETGGLRAAAFDSFSTRNNFYGAQVGGRWSFTRDRITVDVAMKLGLGGMGQEAAVQGGSTVVMASGTRLDRPGGLLALSSNIGDYDRKKLVCLCDFSIGVGCCLAPNVMLRLGYDALWLNNVLRPGDQIDTAVNPTLLPFSARSPTGAGRPHFRFNGDSFYMHGISLGLAVQF